MLLVMAAFSSLGPALRPLADLFPHLPLPRTPAEQLTDWNMA